MTLKILLLFLLLAQILLVSSGHISQEMEEEEEIMDVDEGTNMTIQCKGRDGIVKNPNDTYWTHDHIWFGAKKEHVLLDGSLQLLQVTRQFSGHYKCLQKPNHLVKDVRLIVRGPPPPPTRVSVRPATVLAVVAFHYNMPEEQEQDPVKLHLVYRPIHSEDWHLLPHHISPTQKEVDVFKLEPNTTYEFCLWANNSYGPSSNVTVIATTLHEMTEIELARQLLEVSQGFTPKAWIVAVLVSLVVINVFVGVMAVLYCRYYKTHTDNMSLLQERLLATLIEVMCVESHMPVVHLQQRFLTLTMKQLAKMTQKGLNLCLTSSKILHIRSISLLQLPDLLLQMALPAFVGPLNHLLHLFEWMPECVDVVKQHKLIT